MVGDKMLELLNGQSTLLLKISL